jgi:acetyl-CoA acetyltransferase family protein
MSMTDAYIVAGVRTPIGRYGGALATVRPDDLAAHVLRELLVRVPDLDPTEIDEVVLGCANQAGEDNRNVARMAVLLAGLPDTVPGTTVNRLCGSGLDAVLIAARQIRSGEADIVVAGGVESMSRAPYVIDKAAQPYDRSAKLYDTTIGWRFINDAIAEHFGVDSMPETAENVAADFNVSRADQDAFAMQSQDRAARAQASGRLAKEIAPLSIPRRRAETLLVEHDEHPRPTSLKELAALKTPFRQDGSVTAGNASGINDGAAALLIASGEAVERLGAEPLARIVGGATAGVPPRIMGYGPVPATRRLLARLGRGVGDCGGAPGPRPPGGRRAREPQRRRDRSGASAGHERSADRAHSGNRTARAQREARAVHDVHRRWARDRRRTGGCVRCAGYRGAHEHQGSAFHRSGSAVRGARLPRHVDGGPRRRSRHPQGVGVLPHQGQGGPARRDRSGRCSGLP